MTAKDIHPFLWTVSSPTQPLGAALPTVVTPEVTSPWTPRATAEPAPVGPTADELSQLIDAAHAQGIADGLAETAALRGHLARLVDQLAAAYAQIAEPAAETIADAATCVVEAWLGHTDRSALFLPVIRGWLTASTAGQPALPTAEPPPPAIPLAPVVAPTAFARVHPDDVAALTAAIAGAPIAIVGDPSVAPGAIELRGPAHEISHSWTARLPELRAAIITALTAGDDGAGA